MYDVSRRESFDNLSQWLQEVEVYSPGGGRDVVKLLVGNKVDLNPEVPREEVEAWARSHGMLFLEASAKTCTGVQQAFREVVEKILENPVLLANTTPGRPKDRVRVTEENATAEGAGGCCG